MEDCSLFKEKEFRKFGNPKEINNRFFVCKEKKFIFCEVPKTGITTIKKTLAELLEEKEINYNVHDRKSFILKSPCNNNLTREDFNKMFKFTFVRNPYTRILSAYLDKIKKDSIEKQQIYNFAGISLEYEISFLEFLKILEKIPPVNMNPHFRPQYINICYPLVNYDFIGKFENFNEDLIKVLSKFFEKIQISVVDHHKTKANYKLKKFYNLEAIKLVQRIYAQDFLYFDYNILYNY